MELNPVMPYVIGVFSGLLFAVIAWRTRCAISLWGIGGAIFGLTLATIVPVIAAILTLVTAVFAVLAWKERYWTTINRVHYTLVTIALIGMLWWVNFWNLWVFCL